jgi:type I restriction enzyme S subunit
VSSPSGWRTARLDELCDINPPKPSLKGVKDSTPALFVPMASIDEASGTIAGPKQSTVGVVGRKSYRSFTSGDVLFAKITPCMENGKSALVPEIPTGYGFGSTEFHVLRPKLGTHAQLIWHLVRQQSFRNRAADHFTGTVGQLRVPPDYLRSFEMLIPIDPDAQEKLAGVLDLSTAGTRSAASHLATASRSIERFRRAVLAAACSGRLTSHWRVRHPNGSGVDLADQLTQSDARRSKRTWKPLGETFHASALPETWGVAPFGAATENQDGRRVPLRATARATRQGPYPYYGASGVIDHIDDYLYDGDYLLVSEDGANLLARNTPIAFRADGQFWVNNHAHVVRGRDGVVNAFLEAVINGRDIQDYVTGSAQPKLTQAALNEIPVPVPSTDEQLEIVRQVERLLRIADGLHYRVEAARKRVDRSSQAVLAKAFRGGLLEDKHER